MTSERLIFIVDPKPSHTEKLRTILGRSGFGNITAFAGTMFRFDAHDENCAEETENILREENAPFSRYDEEWLKHETSPEFQELKDKTGAANE